MAAVLSPPPQLTRSDGHTPNTMPPPIVQQYFQHIEKKPDTIYLCRIGYFYHVWGNNAQLVSELTGLVLDTQLYNTRSVAWSFTKHVEILEKLSKNGFKVDMFHAKSPERTIDIEFGGEKYTLAKYDGYVKAVSLAKLYNQDPDSGAILDYYIQIMNWLIPSVKDVNGEHDVKVYHIYGHADAEEWIAGFPGWEKRTAKSWIKKNILQRTARDTHDRTY